jgi:hypothetical protein
VTHEDCQSVFDETLELELNLVYNQEESKFEQKLVSFGICRQNSPLWSSTRARPRAGDMSGTMSQKSSTTTSAVTALSRRLVRQT